MWLWQYSGNAPASISRLDAMDNYGFSMGRVKTLMVSSKNDPCQRCRGYSRVVEAKRLRTQRGGLDNFPRHLNFQT